MNHLPRNIVLFVMLILISGIAMQPVLAQVGAQVPLAPTAIPQFVDPVPHFAGLRVNAKAGGDLFIKMVPSTQVAVSTGTVLNGGTVAPNNGVGLANVWVYQISTNGVDYTPPLWPAFTIEAQRGNALNVTYSNELTNQTYGSVGLIVDQTLHWANPAGFDGSNPPAVVHLHGGEVPPWSDGGPDAWMTPGIAETGHAFVTNTFVYPNTQEEATLWFHDHALGVTRLNVYAGMAGFYFLRGPEEEAANLPGWSGDDLVQEVAPLGASGVFNPNPYLPEIELAIQDRMFDTDGKLYFPSVGILNNGHPFWVPEFIGDVITVNGKTWPYLSVAPRKYRFRLLNGSNSRFYELWLQDLVTGAFGPGFQQVGTDGALLDAPVIFAPGQKLVLAPGERTDVVIDFSGSPGAVWTMRNSGRAPYPKGGPVNGKTTGRIMQFVVNGTMVDGTDVNTTAEDNSLVKPALRTIPLVPLTNFAGTPAAGVAVNKTRLLTLNEVMSMNGPKEALVNNTKWGGLSVATDVFPTVGVRTDFTPINNVPDPMGPMDITYYSEITDEGKTEIWKIINMTGDAHPIHLHLVQFQLMSRQAYNVNKYTKVYDALFPGSNAIDPMTGLAHPPGVFIGGYGPPLNYNTPNAAGEIGGNPDITRYLQGPVKPANPNERGWKDTFIMNPGEVTTVIARWAPTDLAVNALASDLYFPFNPNGGHGYVWHCHIIDHEDNEMMRPYSVALNPAAPVPADRPVLDPPTLLASRLDQAESGLLLDEQPVAQNLPAAFELGQNYPNPFNPSTEIRFTLPDAAHVTMTLYNSVGEQVKTLIDADAPAGYHTVKLDARGLASGVYYYRIQAGSFTDVKSMILLK